jgi:hypothetical protein
VTSHDPSRPNFSENTSLSEVLFIARKLHSRELPGDTKFINLWRNPRTIYEALDVAERVRMAKGTSIKGSGFTTIETQTQKLAEVVTTPHIEASENWSGALFAQTELFRTASHLATGELAVAGQPSATIPICALADLGALGPDRKRIHEGFTVSVHDKSPYAGFWGHKSDTVKQMMQTPNCCLINWLESPRGPEYGKHLWKRAGTILLVERLRTNTHRVVAVAFDTVVLGNTWWAFKSSLALDRRKTLVLWLNSTLGILLMFARRVITQGAWMQFKQPAWEAMPVLNVSALTSDQTRFLAAAYDRLCGEQLMPIARLDEDPVRIEIDNAMMKVLDLPNVAYLRTLLANESGLTGTGADDDYHEAEPERDAA